MELGDTCEDDAQGMQPVAGTHQVRVQGIAKGVSQGIKADQSAQGDGHLIPPHDIQGNEFGLDPARLHIDQFAAFGPSLVGVAALEVAGEHDARRFLHDLAGVDMSQGPIVIALGRQGRNIGGGILLLAMNGRRSNSLSGMHCRIGWS